METTTLPQYSLGCSGDIFNCVRIAMHGDSELMVFYVNLAILSAMTRLIRDVGPDGYSTHAWAELNLCLEEARRQVRSEKVNATKRWDSYHEPPF